MSNNKNKTILIIEDDKISQIYYKKALTIRAYKIIIVNDGYNAFRELNKKNIDLLITDIRLPKTSGYEVIKAIRNNENKTKQHLPIIVITAYTMKNDWEKAISAGADDYISKPVSLERLYSVVEKWIGYQEAS